MEDAKEAKFSHLYSEIFPSTGPNDALKGDDILKTLARDPVEFEGHRTEVLRRLENKPLLLDNPESKRSARKAKRPPQHPSNVLRRPGRRAQDKGAITSLKYEQLLPLHRLWEGYMKDLMSCTQRANLENALLRADYHGAHLRVIQSRCPSFVGRAGLLVQETMQTFVIIESSNRSIVIPKAGSVFACEILLPSSSGSSTKDIVRWQLFGDQLRQHSGLRSSKKFKSRFSVALQ